jgi:hypothetical protein
MKQEKRVYKVIMTNFGNVVYEGMDPNIAVEKAVKCGFEAVLYTDGVPTQTYSTISGWQSVK